MNKRNLVTAIDDNYVYPLVVSFGAAILNSDTKMRCTVGFDSKLLSNSSIKLVGDFFASFGVEYRFVPLTINEAWQQNGHISPIAFARLPLADELELPFIWLDVDTLPRKGWDEIFQSQFFESSQPIAAVPDEISENSPQTEIRQTNQAKLEARDRYFNSGVIGVNPLQWRKNELDKNWKMAINSYDELGFEWSDQCVLNYITKGEYFTLDRKFNQIVGLGNQNFQNSLILHFAGGGLKPWVFLRIPGAIKVLILANSRNKKVYLEYKSSEENVLRAIKTSNPDLYKQIIKIRKKPKMIEVIREVIKCFVKN